LLAWFFYDSQLLNISLNFKAMNDGQVAVLELRRLLYELKDQRPDICVRFRLLGDMWQTSFHHVKSLTERGVILTNESKNETIAIMDLREVVQFELDARYQNYHPHNHYSIETTMNISERQVNSGH
jgi:hypothetical protein